MFGETRPQGAAGDWGERLRIFLFLLIYITGLWGQAGRLLPAPFDDWYSVPYRLLGAWWHGLMPSVLGHSEQVALFQVIAAWALAFALPLLALRLLGISGRQAGLGLPDPRGWMVTLSGVLLTLPVGFWLATQTAQPWDSTLREALEFLIIPPEHFLVFGVFGVLLLPGNRLSCSIGLDEQAAAGLFTMLAAGLVFGLLHVGTPHPQELMASYPLGILFAVMTYLSGSIWPAAIAHVTLNIVPMLLLSSLA